MGIYAVLLGEGRGNLICEHLGAVVSVGKLLPLLCGEAVSGVTVARCFGCAEISVSDAYLRVSVFHGQINLQQFWRRLWSTRAKKSHFHGAVPGTWTCQIVGVEARMEMRMYARIRCGIVRQRRSFILRYLSSCLVSTEAGYFTYWDMGS